MVFRKRFKRRFRRKAMKRKGSHTLRHRIQKVERVQRQRKPEVKESFNSTGFATLVIPQAGNVGSLLLPTIIQGTATTERIGDVVHLQSMAWRFIFRTSSVIADAQHIRVIVIQQRSILAETAAAPNLDDVLALPTEFRSPLRPRHDRRHHILIADRIFRLGQGSLSHIPSTDVAVSTTNDAFGTIFLKIPIRNISFVDDAGVIVKSGEIYFWVFTSNATTAGLFTHNLHTRWTDI